MEGLNILEFKSIELTDKAVFDRYFAVRVFNGSECTFTNMFAWRTCYKICWAVAFDSLIIKVTRKNGTFILPPFNGRDEDLPNIWQAIKEAFAENSFEIRGIYEESIARLKPYLPPETVFAEDRDNWDYVYEREALATLGGRKYHSKKNHANAFRKEHPDYVFHELTTEDVEECLHFARHWSERRAQEEPELQESLSCELYAMEAVLTNLRYLNVRGGVIRVNGEVEAFSIGEKLNQEMAVIHFEKANPEIRGLYTVINQDFCQKIWTDVKYVNREEDMGIPGLQKAKESYHPVFMVKKYCALVD